MEKRFEDFVGGGSNIALVQTTGTRTDAAMSQNATTLSINQAVANINTTIELDSVELDMLTPELRALLELGNAQLITIPAGLTSYSVLLSLRTSGPYDPNNIEVLNGVITEINNLSADSNLWSTGQQSFFLLSNSAIEFKVTPTDVTKPVHVLLLRLKQEDVTQSYVDGKDTILQNEIDVINNSQGLALGKPVFARTSTGIIGYDTLIEAINDGHKYIELNQDTYELPNETDLNGLTIIGNNAIILISSGTTVTIRGTSILHNLTIVTIGGQFISNTTNLTLNLVDNSSLFGLTILEQNRINVFDRSILAETEGNGIVTLYDASIYAQGNASTLQIVDYRPSINTAVSSGATPLFDFADNIITPYAIVLLEGGGLFVNGSTSFTFSYPQLKTEVDAVRVSLLKRGIQTVNRIDLGNLFGGIALDDFALEEFTIIMDNSTAAFELSRGPLLATTGSLFSFNLVNNTSDLIIPSENIDIQPRLLKNGFTERILLRSDGTNKWQLISDSLGVVSASTSIDESNLVHRTNNELIAGVKTITGGLIFTANSSSPLLEFTNPGISEGVALKIGLSVGNDYFLTANVSGGGFKVYGNGGSVFKVTNQGIVDIMGAVTAPSFNGSPIVTSPNGSKYRINVANDGTLSTTLI